MPRSVVIAALVMASASASASCPPEYQAATELRITLERVDRVWAGEADGAMGMAEVVDRKSVV